MRAQPKSPIAALAQETTAQLAGLVGADPVPPRATADYLLLLEPRDGPEDEDAS
jgi:hypothetical protein